MNRENKIIVVFLTMTCLILGSSAVAVWLFYPTPVSKHSPSFLLAFDGQIPHPTNTTDFFKGELWYCLDHNAYEYWNGTNILKIG